MYAAEKGRAEVVTILLDGGAAIGLRDKNGRSAEDLAASKGYREIAVQIDWWDARKQNTANRYQRFLERHLPNQFSEQARQRALELSWQDAARSDTVENYDRFALSFPGTDLATKARARAIELMWQEAIRQDTVESYNNFAQKHQGTEWATKAQGKISELFASRARVLDADEVQLLEATIMKTLRQKNEKFSGSLISQQRLGDLVLSDWVFSDVVWQPSENYLHFSGARITVGKLDKKLGATYLMQGRFYQFPPK